MFNSTCLTAEEPGCDLKGIAWMSHMEGKAFWLTYVVMEGLGLAGVLARLPSVWSRTIQIPEHAKREQRGHRVSQRNKRSKCTTAIHNQFAHSRYRCSALTAALIHLSTAVRATRGRRRPSSIYFSLTPKADTSLLEQSVG